MVLGCVLADCKERRTQDLKYFCDPNTKDFRPTSGNNLAVTYSAQDLIYLDDFAVP